MADIGNEAGVTPDDSALEGASKLFGFLWRGAWDNAAATANGDAEALHDMRVNLRRLRTTMQNFEGPKNAPLLSKTLRRELRAHNGDFAKIGDWLGNVRDHDVLTEYVEKYARKKLKSEVSQVVELQKFADYLQSERADAFRPMKKGLEKGQKSGHIREEFARWALGLPAASGASLSMKNAADIVLERRLNEVLARSDALEAGRDEEEQHELRKSLRRLRYSLETFAPCLSESPKEKIKTLVEMQDILGEMQDRAILQETATRAFGKQFPPAIEKFLAHGTQRRRHLLGKIRGVWNDAREAGFWDDVRALFEEGEKVSG